MSAEQPGLLLQPAELLDPPPDPELVRNLLADQAPNLADEPVVQLPGGRDNAAFRIGDDYIARLPLHGNSEPLMRTEQRWLPDLTRRLSIATSAPLVVGEPGHGYPYPWSVAHWIPGDTADRTAFDPGQAAEALLDLWRGLHHPAPEDAPTNPVRSVPLRDRVPRFREQVADLDHPHGDSWISELEALSAVPVSPKPRVWCHGDLHPRNIVVDDRRVVGVIDWGDLHGGDPVVDYAAAWMMLPSEQRERVRRELDVADDVWERARGWALVFGVLLMRIGTQDGDEPVRATGELALMRAMSLRDD